MAMGLSDVSLQKVINNFEESKLRLIIKILEKKKRPNNRKKYCQS